MMMVMFAPCQHWQKHAQPGTLHNNNKEEEIFPRQFKMGQSASASISSGQRSNKILKGCDITQQQQQKTTTANKNGKEDEEVVDNKLMITSESAADSGATTTNAGDINVEGHNKQIRMTSYSNNSLLLETNNNNNSSVFGRIAALSSPAFKKKMSAEKRVAALEQELKCKEEEIKSLQQAIKQMPDYAKLQGKHYQNQYSLFLNTVDAQ